MAILPAVVILLAAAAPARPTAAIFSIQATAGTEPSVAELMTEVFISEVARLDAFSRVVSSRDVEAALNFEKQRQLMNCEDSGCVAEIAGALGVDFLLTGVVGKAGDANLISMRLLETRTGSMRASVTQLVCGKSAEYSVRAVTPLVEKLLFSAKLIPGGKVTAAPAHEGCAEPAAPLPSTMKSTGGPSPLRIAGLAVVASAVPVVLLGVLALLVTGAGVGAFQWLPQFRAAIPTPGADEGTHFYAALWPFVASGVVGGAAFLVATVGVLAGAGLLAASLRGGE